MHVDEAFSGQQTIKLEVINSNGDSYRIEVTPDLNVEKLKVMCLAHFHSDPLISIKIAQQFKMVSISKNKTLAEDATIKDEEMEDESVILLLPRYSYVSNNQESLSREMKSQAPTLQDINEATANLTPKHLDRSLIDISNSIDFQKELRKILISLIDYAERLLRNHPEVSPIFCDVNYDECRNKSENDDEDDGINKEALKQLTDMGFAVERAKRALKINNMSSVDAMDWLLAYETSSSSITKSKQNVQQYYESTSSGNKAAAKSHYCSPVGVCERVPTIIECYRAFKRKHFKPNAKAAKGLSDMGFDTNEILDALCLHSNNELAACEWLLSERRPKLQDLQYGLSKESPIYKAIISNPVIQLGLVKPRIFFAFLQLVEEPNSTGRWLSDPDTSPILSQVFRIYHSEKHAIEQIDSNNKAS